MPQGSTKRRESIKMSEIYLFKAPKKSGDGLADFLEYLSEYVSGPELYVEDCELASYIIGDFIQEYAGRECDYIPALVVMDEDGNATEYYCFSSPDTIKHEEIARPESEEDRRARRVFDAVSDPFSDEGYTLAEAKMAIKEDPAAVIDCLLDIVERY
jgi:hypothetical protein